MSSKKDLSIKTLNFLERLNLNFDECQKLIKVFEMIDLNVNKFRFADDLATENFFKKISNVFGSRNAEVIKNFLVSFTRVFISNKFSNLSRKLFIRDLQKKISHKFGIRTVKIVTAQPLNDEQARFAKEIAVRYGASFNDNFIFEVSSKIVGGFKIFFPDRLVDLSFESLISGVYNRVQ